MLAELEFGLRDRNLGPGDHNLGLGDLGRLQSRTFSIPSRALDEIGFGLRDHILRLLPILLFGRMSDLRPGDRNLRLLDLSRLLLGRSSLC